MKTKGYAVGKNIIVKLIAGKITISEGFKIAQGIEKGDILIMEIKEVIKAKDLKGMD
ncbi:hypothetical protein [Thermococcus sibiricus]|uniref:Uncharacterized protein n=1 Tax=Thermococcus sibiricus TaxID=172049 RepID=A0A101EMB1_9EURY|nr:hypothetical protein [Thermococcus sibiricus]KUK18016.1 MAG: hypothetical protein XD54_0743 [Thermococcus sibiricus]